jgi:hypothetical protein
MLKVVLLENILGNVMITLDTKLRSPLVTSTKKIGTNPIIPMMLKGTHIVMDYNVSVDNIAYWTRLRELLQFNKRSSRELLWLNQRS